MYKSKLMEYGTNTNTAKNLAIMESNMPLNVKKSFVRQITGKNYEDVEEEYNNYFKNGLSKKVLLDFEGNVRSNEDVPWKGEDRSVGLYIVANKNYTDEEKLQLFYMNDDSATRDKRYAAYQEGVAAGWTPEKMFEVKQQIDALNPRYPNKKSYQDAVAALGYTGNDAKLLLKMVRTDWFG